MQNTETLTLEDFLLARIAEDEASANGSRLVPKPTEQIECLCGDKGHLTKWGSTIEITHVRGWSPPEIRAGWVMGDGHTITETHVLEADDAAAICATWPLAPSSVRPLAECEAKRRIVELHEHPEGSCWEMHRGVYGPGWPEGSYAVEGQPWAHPSLEGPDVHPGPCETLQLLALPYADHPDYRQEWRP